MKKRGKDMETEGKRFRLEELDDQKFEAFISELLDYSIELKRRFNYTEAKLKEGGRDKGQDCVLYKEQEIVGIVQCKHSINVNAMPRGIIVNEILKMLLYLYIQPELLPTSTKKYIFFISSKLSLESLSHLKNFKKNEMSDRKELQDKILKLHKKYAWIKEKINKENINEEFFLKLEEIFESLEKSYLTDIDIQTYLSSENPDIGLLISKYFPVKKVISKEVFDFPRIKKDEEEFKKYNQERFHGKLKEILSPDKILEDALKAYSNKILYTVELFKTSSFYIKEDLKEYHDVIKDREINLREEKKIELEIENFENDRLIKEYLIYYLKVLRDVENCKFRNFDYIPPDFARGTVQELVNIKEIYDWLLLKGGKK